jgi:hypothetical protein
MAVPRPVLLAILGLALCVTALIAVRGVGVGEEDPVAPAPIPTAPAPKADPAPSAAARPQKEEAAPKRPAKPAEAQPKADPKPERRVSPAEVAKLKDEAMLSSVGKALAEKDVVVLFFSRPGAADDTGARRAVGALRGMRGVQVFSPRFEALDGYRPVLAGVGVAQVPAVVIARPGRQAVVVEGFVDRKSLRQQVEDALR